MKVERVVIIMAMFGEAKHLIKRLGLGESSQTLPGLPAAVFTGGIKGKEVILITNGECPTHKIDRIGPQPAGVTAYAAIQKFKPDVIINAGTAGGFEKRNGHIGDVYLGTKTKYHDRRIKLGDNFEAYGHAIYTCLPGEYTAETLGLKRGVVSTGSSLDAPALDVEDMNHYGVVAKEMEAAAIAEVSALLHVPFIAIKAITDIVDHPADTAEQFLKNFSIAVKSLTDKTEELVNFVVGKTLVYLANGPKNETNKVQNIEAAVLSE